MSPAWNTVISTWTLALRVLLRQIKRLAAVFSWKWLGDKPKRCNKKIGFLSQIQVGRDDFFNIYIYIYIYDNEMTIYDNEMTTIIHKGR